MRFRFRTKLFVAASGVGIITALVAAGLLHWALRTEMQARIEERLLLETHLVADVVARSVANTPPSSWDAEADRIATVVGARVTFIDATGHVVGDSALDARDLPRLEDHASRPEVVEALQSGIGRRRRYSTTTDTEMLYTAAAVGHPAVRVVRLAVPITEEKQQLRSVVPLTLLAIGIGLPCALLLAWAFSLPLSRRVAAIARVAERYSAGDLTRPPIDYGDDELGTVARTLDGAVQELGRRLADLAHNRARMEAILAGMVEGVLVVDEHGRVRLANQAARRMLNVDDGAIGRRYTEAIRHPDIVRQVATALGGAEAPGVELTFGRDQARVFIARATAARGPDSGAAVLVLHDITDLRRADQIRRDFVANVSHELRTPLTAIRGYVEALLDESPTDEAREFLQVIFRHTTRMERLVGDLLRLARLDARQETPDLSRTDVGSVIDAVRSDLLPLIESRGAVVQATVEEAARDIVTDPAKLHDVLRNLLENAISYSPEGGTATITARAVGDAAVIEVADEGPGIPAADLQRVFERFYRVDRSRVRNPGGTGIGLAIVKNLVELLGGSVVAANREGGGAVFTVRLPRAASGPVA